MFCTGKSQSKGAKQVEGKGKSEGQGAKSAHAGKAPAPAPGAKASAKDAKKSSSWLPSILSLPGTGTATKTPTGRRLCQYLLPASKRLWELHAVSA